MSDQTATLNVLLRLQSDVSGIKAAASSLDGFINKVKAGFTFDVGGQIAGAIASIPAKLQELGSQALALAANLKDAKERFNASGEALQVLGLAAENGGASVEVFYKSITQLNKSLADARDPSSQAAIAFRRLGIDAAALEGLPLERKFEAIARAQIGAKDQTVAFRSVIEILGKGAPVLQGALQDLASQGYDNLAKSASDAGRVMEDATIARLDRAQKSIEKFKNQTVIAVGELIAKLDQMREKTEGKEIQTALKNGLLGPLAAITTLREFFSTKVTAPAGAGGAPAAPTPAPVDTASVQRLVTLENTLGEIRARRLVVDRDLQEVEQLISSIQSDSLLTREQKEGRVNKALTDQQVLLAKRGALLEDERKTLAASAKLQDQGFVVKGDNSPDLVASRNVNNFNSKNLTPEQLKLLDEKRKRDAGAGAVADQGGENAIAQAKSETSSYLTTFTGQLQQSMALLQSGFVTAAQAITGVMGTAISSVSEQMVGLINGTTTWRDALTSVGLAIEQSLVKAFADMAAQWLIQHTIMAAVSDAFRAGEITGHIVMEEAKTGATATGEGVRTGVTLGHSLVRRAIHLAETIYHGIQVAIRTAAHIGGELLKTATTIVHAGIRIGVILAESIASVIQGAVEAFSAMASIPYVGPFLGAAAMAAALAGGFALVKGISKGFEGGGYTGDGASSQPAGIVHAGEWVVPADRTREIGLARLSAMTYGGALPGYMQGGLVAPAGSAGGDDQSGRGGSQTNVTLTPRFIVVDSDREAARLSDSEANEAYFLRMARKHGIY